MSDPKDFIIERGVLKKYNGPGGDVVIPKGVISIGKDAFHECSSLTGVVIPEGVTSIEGWAFFGCRSLTGITILGSVTSIGECAFSGCAKLKNLHILDPKYKINADIFGDQLPTGLCSHIEDLVPLLTDKQLKQYVLTKTVWAKLPPEQQAELFMTRQGKPLLPAYLKCIQDHDALGRAILQPLGGKPSAKACAAAASFMVMFSQVTDPEVLRQLWEALKPLKTAAKALQAIEADEALMGILRGEQEADENLPTAERKVQEILREQKQTFLGTEVDFNSFYALAPSALPPVQYTDGTNASPQVLMWLLTAHEKQYNKTDITAAYNKPGVKPKAAEVAAELDKKSFQACLRRLADENLGFSSHNKKMFLAYPICRYADEELMSAVTRRAPGWRSATSGDYAPPFRIFCQAVLYRGTRAAMLFADRFHDLDGYAWIRGTTADTIRDQFLSDVGLDVRGGKTYDLGNQAVTARLQADLSFLIELENGKTAKSLPKKGADPEKHAAANADFYELKKSSKQIVKNRISNLFEDFLSGRSRAAADWTASYTGNPLLRQVASLLVWSQGGRSFTLKDGRPVDSAGEPYLIGEAAITVAHPMEITKKEITAWQKYFTAHGLKQPFAQVWEPVYRAEDIQPDRYAGCALPINHLRSRDKHGIFFDYSYGSSPLCITFQDCEAEYEVEGDTRHYLSPDATVTVTSFRPEKFSRTANHIVGLLDKWTIHGRILKDDVTVVEILQSATLAQVTDYLNLAMKNSCTNCTAALLAYKNNHFSGFDPMAEFTLENL